MAYQAIKLQWATATFAITGGYSVILRLNAHDMTAIRIFGLHDHSGSFCFPDCKD